MNYSVEMEFEKRCKRDGARTVSTRDKKNGRSKNESAVVDMNKMNYSAVSGTTFSLISTLKSRCRFT